MKGMSKKIQTYVVLLTTFNQQQYDSLVNLQNTLDASKEVRSVPISGQNEGIGSVIFFYFGNLQEFDVNGTQRFGRQTWTKPVEQIFCHLGRLWEMSLLPPIQLQQLCQEQGLIPPEGPPSLLTDNFRLTWKRGDKTSPPLLILIYLIPPQGHEHLVNDVVDTEDEERCLHVIIQPDRRSSTLVTCNSFLWYSTFSSTQHGSCSCTPFFLSAARAPNTSEGDPTKYRTKVFFSLSSFLMTPKNSDSKMTLFLKPSFSFKTNCSDQNVVCAMDQWLLFFENLNNLYRV